jgi:hypothetical protein
MRPYKPVSKKEFAIQVLMDREQKRLSNKRTRYINKVIQNVQNVKYSGMTQTLLQVVITNNPYLEDLIKYKEIKAVRIDGRSVHFELKDGAKVTI